MVDNLPKNGLLCSVCRQPQVLTPQSGATCENDHGGVYGIDEDGERVFSGLSNPCDSPVQPPPPPYAAFGSPRPVQPSREVMTDLLALVRKHWPNEPLVVQKAMTVDMAWIALKKGEAD